MSGRLIQRTRECAGRLEPNTVHHTRRPKSRSKRTTFPTTLRGGPAVPQGILGEVVPEFHKLRLTHGAAGELHTPSWWCRAAACCFASSFVRGGGLGFRLWGGVCGRGSREGRGGHRDCVGGTA